MPGAIAETKPYLKGLDDYYQREIEPWLVSREAERLDALRRRWIIIGIGVGGAAVLALLLLAAKLNTLWLLLPAALAALAVFLGIRATSRLSSEVKAFLAEKLAGFFGFTYHADPVDDPTHRFRQLGLVPSF